MLREFIAVNREEIIRRCRTKVATRSVSPPTDAEIDHGVPVFLDQLMDALRLGLTSSPDIGRSAVKHGHDLLRQGFTVSQVVHDYGDVCQSITDLAVETNAPISTDDFRSLNRCLDDAIASAVTEFGREQNQSTLDGETARGSQRAGFLAHELRNVLNTAIMAFEVLKTGDVGVAGSTGTVLHRSLMEARALIGRSLAEVRLNQGVQNREPFLVSEFIGELAPAATLEANAHGIGLTVMPVEDGVAIEADRQVLAAVVGNLLQNAFKYTRPRYDRDAERRRQRRARADRDPGRMRRSPRGKHQRIISPVRTAQRRSHRPRSGPGLQPMGRRSEQWPDLCAQRVEQRMRLHP